MAIVIKQTVNTFNFQIGKTDPKVASRGFLQNVSATLFDLVSKQAEQGRIINFKEFERDMTNAIRNSYVKAIQYATMNLIGLPSPRGTSEQSFSAGSFFNYGSVVSKGTDVEDAPKGKIYWPSLDFGTQKKKGHNKYFIDTGQLKSRLSKMAKQMVNRTGVVKLNRKMTVAKSAEDLKRRDSRGHFLPQTMKLADLDMTIMPKLPAGLLPGVQANRIDKLDHSQGFEAFLISDKKLRDKLLGPSAEKRRHLLQPVFTFWTNYYVPNEIGKSLQRAVRK